MHPPNPAIVPSASFNRRAATAAFSLVLLAIVLGVVMFASLGSPLKDDIAWLLYVARRWMAGRELYVDVVEVNPPLIVWISAVPLTVAGWFNVSPQFVAMPGFVAVVLGCGWWAATLLRKQGGLFRDRMPVFAVIGIVLLIVLAAKFIYGAYLAVIAMAAVFLLMRGIRNHYAKVARETAVGPMDARLLPSRVRAVIMVQEVNKPTMRAVNFARATRASSIEAVTVSIDDAETKATVASWDAQELEVPLKVIASPYREVTGPFLNYVKGLRSDNPRDVVCVYIPEYIVGHWWEQLLHNQTGLILKTRLNFMQGVMVTSVPYQLASSKYAIDRAQRNVAAAWRRPGTGQVRMGDRPRDTTEAE